MFMICLVPWCCPTKRRQSIMEVDTMKSQYGITGSENSRSRNRKIFWIMIISLTKPCLMEEWAGWAPQCMSFKWGYMYIQKRGTMDQGFPSREAGWFMHAGIPRVDRYMKVNHSCQFSFTFVSLLVCHGSFCWIMHYIHKVIKPMSPFYCCLISRKS